MRERVAGFDWDEGNREKCQKHDVTVAQIEAAFRGPMRVFPDPGHSAAEMRYLGIGRAAGRHTLTAFTYRTIDGERLIRPISARFMHAKEIQHYEAQSEDPGEAAPTED
ncbi:MAG: BrnT family toxin [Steroidobacteraceae bacterium]